MFHELLGKIVTVRGFRMVITGCLVGRYLKDAECWSYKVESGECKAAFVDEDIQTVVENVICLKLP